MKNKRKFNFIDILIILIIASGIFFGFKKFSKASVSSTSSTNKSNKLKITYFMEEVPDYTVESIQIGDPVREEIQNSNFGSIVDIKTDNSISWARDKEGNFIKSSRDGYLSLELVMEANGFVGENGVTIDKSVYYVGQTLGLFAGNSVLKTGRISDIQVIE